MKESEERSPLRVRWTAFLQAGTEAKAVKLLGRLGEKLGRETETHVLQKYWKDKSLFEAVVTSRLEAQEPVGATFETLGLCDRVASKWVVGAPQQYDGGVWEFAGWADSRTLTVAGVKDLSFFVTNDGSRAGEESTRREEGAGV